MTKFVKNSRVPAWGKTKWKDEDLKFVKDNCAEMSTIELAAKFASDINDEVAMKASVDKVKSMCSKRGFSYFSENPLNWKRKGYKPGPDGYALYPYKGDYKQSLSVTNEMLKGA